MSHIFISYSHEDSEYVFQLREQMMGLGFQVWIDEEIEYGERWFPSIGRAIENCSAFIVVMTPEAEQSTWVEKEILIAQKNRKKIFGLLLRGDGFLILINEQHVPLEEKFKFLPRLPFYQFLSNYAPRTQKEVKKPEYPPVPQLINNDEKKDYFIDINIWIKHVANSNDYYGITMLALAFEERDMHDRAIYHLRQANMLESRIKNKAWMNHLHGWQEKHHSILESIISDLVFWRNYNRI